MKQREVRDGDGVAWTCVQALSGLSGEAAKTAEDKVADDGMVAVVCTPSGGAQSVRLELPLDWMGAVSDDELLKRIASAG